MQLWKSTLSQPSDEAASLPYSGSSSPCLFRPCRHETSEKISVYLDFLYQCCAPDTKWLVVDWFWLKHLPCHFCFQISEQLFSLLSTYMWEEPLALRKNLEKERTLENSHRVFKHISVYPLCKFDPIVFVSMHFRLFYIYMSSRTAEVKMNVFLLVISLSTHINWSVVLWRAGMYSLMDRGEKGMVWPPLPLHLVALSGR